MSSRISPREESIRITAALPAERWSACTSPAATTTRARRALPRAPAARAVPASASRITGDQGPTDGVTERADLRDALIRFV